LRWILILIGICQVCLGAGLLSLPKSPSPLYQIECFLTMATGCVVFGIGCIVSAIQVASKRNLKAIERLRLNINGLAEQRRTPKQNDVDDAFQNIG
jgi:hypothetical protein